MFRDKLMHQILALPSPPDPKYAAPDSDTPRKKILPHDSVFLYAETGPEFAPVPIGSISLIQIHSNTLHFKGLPTELDRVGELKRTIVFDEYQRMGIGTKLVEHLELVARDLGLRYLAVETLEALGASRLYEKCGYVRREVWGLYDKESLCFGKWL
jgi:GNAT superfamily N-acetyltransferase